MRLALIEPGKPGLLILSPVIYRQLLPLGILYLYMNLGDNAMRMKHTQYTIDAKVWLYPGESGWYFVTIPYDISEDIKHLFGDKARGWGSIPVVITLGSSSWKTSLFPDKKEGAYILPLKKEIRLKEKIQIGDSLHFLLEVKVS